MKTRNKIAIVLATIIIIVAILIIQSFFPSPKSVFKNLVTKPIPKSVESLEEGHFLAMDSTFWALHFHISRADLHTILDTQHFIPIDENDQFKEYNRKEDYLFHWKVQISNLAKLDINFTNSWQIFFLREGGGTKYFFFDTNSTEAVFVADAH